MRTGPVRLHVSFSASSYSGLVPSRASQRGTGGADQDAGCEELQNSLALTARPTYFAL